MGSCSRCNLCENPGTRAEALEVGKVPCNVRRFQKDVFTLWRCTGCGSIHCEEDADLPRYYADYPLKNQRLGFGERIGYGNRLRLLERHGFRRLNRILDYGCGAGLFVNFLQERGIAHGFGYDPFVAEYADQQDLQSPYDAVVTYDVIEHLDDPRAFVASLKPLVRPGGLVVIGTPNADHVTIGRIGDPSLHPPYHRHILSERMLVVLGREQGMEPIHIHRRSFYDSLYPTVNSRFLWEYLRKSGVLDTAVEPPRTGMVLRSLSLVFLAFFGYFLPARDYVLVTFRKTGSQP